MFFYRTSSLFINDLVVHSYHDPVNEFEKKNLEKKFPDVARVRVIHVSDQYLYLTNTCI